MKEIMKTQVRLWLDDNRNPVKFGCVGWKWVKTYDEAISAFKNFDVIEASLDHDLGIQSTIGMTGHHEKTGYDVVCWLEENGIYPVDGIKVHSMNPIGRKNMLKGIEQIKKISGGG